MRTLTPVLLAACVALSLAACKKAEQAPAAPAAKPPMAAPTSDSKEAWQAYLSDVIPRHTDDLYGQQFVYLLPAETLPDFEEQYGRLLEKSQSDVARTLAAGTLLAYAGRSSAKTADFVIETFEFVQPDMMKGVRLVFVGKPEDQERVRAAVAPSGVEFRFHEVK